MLDATDLGELGSALLDGVVAAEAVANGDPANLEALQNYAEAMEVLHRGVIGGTMSFGWVEPTEADVHNARHLVQLVDQGAPRAALTEPSRRAARVCTDTWALGRFQSALFCLEDETTRVKHLERITEVLDMTIALFERGCHVASFAPTPQDLANARRLRQIATAESAEVSRERRRLVADLGARLPSCNEELARDMATESLYRG